MQPSSGLTRKTQTTYSNPNDRSGRSAFDHSQWSSPYETPSGLGTPSDFTNSPSTGGHQMATTSRLFRMVNASSPNLEQEHTQFAPSSAVVSSVFAYAAATASVDSLNSHHPMQKMRSDLKPAPLRTIPEDLGSDQTSHASSSWNQTLYQPGWSELNSVSRSNYQHDTIFNHSSHNEHKRLSESFVTGITQQDPWQDSVASISSRNTKQKRSRTQSYSTSPSTDKNYQFIQSKIHGSAVNCYGYTYTWMSSRLRVPDSSASDRMNFLGKSETADAAKSIQSNATNFYKKNLKKPDVTKERNRRDCISMINRSYGFRSTYTELFSDVPEKQILQSVTDALKNPGVYFIQDKYITENGRNQAHAIAVDSRDPSQWKLFNCDRGEFNVNYYSIGDAIAKPHMDNNDTIKNIAVTKMELDPYVYQ
jgi:hypothetical protein